MVRIDTPLRHVLVSVQILSHRGQWLRAEERNTSEAFKRSFANGFGTETDLRDMGGELVVSHDPPIGEVESFKDFLSLHRQINPSLPLALNVKSDGLQDLLATAFKGYGVENYFLFDMSVPDLLVSLRKGLRCFSRQSDVEPVPAFYDECEGLWMDVFRVDWIKAPDIRKVVDDGKKAALVSPELHGRPHLPLWERLFEWNLTSESNLLLCTDFPDQAKAFFAC